MAPALAGRTGKILDRFPTFMRAPTPGKALAAVAAALGADLDEAERQAMRIQRAHRLPVAQEELDLLGLAALLDLHPADFFILDSLHSHDFFTGQLPALAPGSPPRTDLDRAQQGYDLFVGRLRSSVRRAVEVTLDGCGTIWSLLEGTAILLDADRLDAAGHPDAGARTIQHLDDGLARGGFVHRMATGYHVWQPAPPPGGPAPSRGWVYLVENPINDHSTDNTPRHQRERFRAFRGGFFDGQVAVQITGVGGRTIRPMVINETDHEGFFYAGVVGDGQKLTFTTDGKAFLDGADVTANAAFFTGGLAAHAAAADPRDSRLAPTDQTVAPAVHASPDNVVDVVTPPHALDRAFPRPALTPSPPTPTPPTPATPATPPAPATPTPTPPTPAPTPPTPTPVTSLPPLDLRLGESTWRFSVEEGAYDLSAYDQAVYAFPEDEAARLALPPSGSVQLRWQENDLFAASVLIPADLKSLEDAGLVQNLPNLVRAGLERYRAAGIRLDVAYFDQAWLLAHSVLTSVDATLPGAAGPPS